MNPYTQGQAMPGMEFFQSLLKGSGMPTGFASWMAPTMDPSELEQKITDLKAVLQWLEANARLTQATIQTLEVQRMTLSALKTMNVDLGDLASRMTEAMQAGAQAMGAAAQDTVDAGGPRADDQPEPEAAWARAPEPEADVESGPEPGAESGAESPDAASALPGVMDPMQWWNAVSQQFSQVATQALRESPWPMPAGGAAAGVAGASASSAGTSATSTSPARGSAGKPQPRKSRAEARSSRGQAASEATAKSPAQSAAKTSTRASTASGPGTARKATAAPRSAASKTRRGSRA